MGTVLVGASFKMAASRSSSSSSSSKSHGQAGVHVVTHSPGEHVTYTTGGTTYTSDAPYSTGGISTFAPAAHPYAGQTISAYQNYSGASTPNAGRSMTAREYQAAREMSMSTTQLTGQEIILGERIVEHEVRVPKRVVREEIVEKVIIVPEKIIHEEVIEETQMVREKIIEVAKPIYEEKIIEVPEIEYVEKIVEVPEKIYQERVKEVVRIEVQERIVEVPKIITQEKIVEVPEISYVEVPIEKIIEVPEIREQVVIKEVSVPQYVDKPIPEHVTVEVPQKVERNIPIPVEAVTTFEYRLPHIRPHYKKATFPIYVPRFVEVPVPEELVSGAVGEKAAFLAQHVSLLTTQSAPSLCEVENIAADIKKMDLARHIASSDYHATIQAAWARGELNITQGVQGANVVSRGIADNGKSAPHGTNFTPLMYHHQDVNAAKKASTKRGKSDRSSRPKSTTSGKHSKHSVRH